MPQVAVLTAEEARARLRQEMEPDTFAHAERAADLARQLAEIHGVDPDRAELAGLLHDIADRYSERELAIRADRYGISVSLTEARVPKLLHAKVGAEILRREWGITDEELLDAVREHITGGVRMSPLSKVTFVADKLEPGRDPTTEASMIPARRPGWISTRPCCSSTPGEWMISSGITDRSTTPWLPPGTGSSTG